MGDTSKKNEETDHYILNEHHQKIAEMYVCSYPLHFNLAYVKCLRKDILEYEYMFIEEGYYNPEAQWHLMGLHSLHNAIMDELKDRYQPSDLILLSGRN